MSVPQHIAAPIIRNKSAHGQGKRMGKKSGGSWLNTLLHSLDKTLAILLGALVFILATGVMISVFLRYVFGVSFAWAEELLTMTFIGTTFFGSALGIREEEHISLGIFKPKNPILRRLFIGINSILLILILSFVFYYSLQWIAKVGSVPSPSMGIKYLYFYIMVPVSFALSIFYAFCNMLGLFMHLDPPSTKSIFEDVTAEGGMQ